MKTMAGASLKARLKIADTNLLDSPNLQAHTDNQHADTPRLMGGGQADGAWPLLWIDCEGMAAEGSHHLDKMEDAWMLMNVAPACFARACTGAGSPWLTFLASPLRAARFAGQERHP